MESFDYSDHRFYRYGCLCAFEWYRDGQRLSTEASYLGKCGSVHKTKQIADKTTKWKSDQRRSGSSLQQWNNAKVEELLFGERICRRHWFPCVKIGSLDCLFRSDTYDNATTLCQRLGQHVNSIIIIIFN